MAKTGKLPPGTPNAHDPFEQFEQANKEAKAPTVDTERTFAPHTPIAGDMLSIVKPSRWTNSNSGETGTEWTLIGKAFRTAKGWKLVIKDGISVTGEVLLLPPDPKRS